MWPEDEKMEKEDFEALESVFNPKIQCSLCGQEFDKLEPLIEERKARHQEFHSHCKKQKRNTTEGIVVWELVD